MSLLVIGLTAANWHAWDGERKGFILGLGIGPGYSSYPEKGGLFTTVKAGYAPTNQLLILSEISTVYISGLSHSTDNLFQGIFGVSVQFFPIEEPGNGVYLLAGAGIHNMAFYRDDWEGGSNNYGFGIRGGVGYEFIKHFSVEGIVQQGFHSESYLSSTSYGIAFTYIFY